MTAAATSMNEAGQRLVNGYDGFGYGTACGTFGELLQGALANPETDFLVTLPIARWSTARFMLHRNSLSNHAASVDVYPPHKDKSKVLAEEMLRRHGIPHHGRLTIASDLPEGKGQASSSADLVATARAIGMAIGVRPAAEEIEGLMRDIEPSDGVMYPGVVAFLHREVRLHGRLGFLPRLSIVAVDEGGQVDTVAFNLVPKSFGTAIRREYQGLLQRITDAVPQGDLGTVGEVATRSALLNQRIRPNSLLPGMLRISRRVGALGVAVAHSGTVLGLLIAEDDPNYPDRVASAKHGCTALAGACWIERTLTHQDEDSMPWRVRAAR